MPSGQLGWRKILDLLLHADFGSLFDLQGSLESCEMWIQAEPSLTLSDRSHGQSALVWSEFDPGAYPYMRAVS